MARAIVGATEPLNIIEQVPTSRPIFVHNCLILDGCFLSGVAGDGDGVFAAGFSDALLLSSWLLPAWDCWCSMFPVATMA